MAKASNFPCDLIGGFHYLRSLSSPTAEYQVQPGMEALVYVYNGMNLRGKLFVTTDFPDTIQVRFSVGFVTSGESGYFTAQAGVWSPQVDLSGITVTGWQELKWSVNWYTRSSGSIDVTGHNVNQVEV